jgi:hypothetical protein
MIKDTNFNINNVIKIKVFADFGMANHIDLKIGETIFIFLYY